jgi:ligand-binding SRPBCC domain-containing protein
VIESWEPGKKFIDRQIKGPYKMWHHTHEFEDVAGGTLIRDRVLYKLPLGRLGEAFSGQMVKSDVAKIFSYRKKVIANLFQS